MKKLIVRTITGVLFVAIMVCGMLSPLSMIVLFILITTLTLWEYGELVNRRPGVSINRFITTVAGDYLFLAMTGFTSGMTTSAVFIPYLITTVYLLVEEIYLKADDPLANWSYTMLSQLYIALPLSLIPVLAFQSMDNGSVTYSFTLPLSVFILLWCNDTGAYCFGSLFGRHKLFPRISPGKTWEGSISGGLFAVAIGALIWWGAERYGINTMRLSMFEWMGLALVVVIFGTWGDLVESLFKRTLGVKDSGHILPGHGGMLDRFDSSLIAIPAAVIYLFSLTMIR